YAIRPSPARRSSDLHDTIFVSFLQDALQLQTEGKCDHLLINARGAARAAVNASMTGINGDRETVVLVGGLGAFGSLVGCRFPPGRSFSRGIHALQHGFVELDLRS